MCALENVKKHAQEINRGHCAEWEEVGVQKEEDFTLLVKNFSTNYFIFQCLCLTFI